MLHKRVLLAPLHIRLWNSCEKLIKKRGQIVKGYLPAIN